MKRKKKKERKNFLNMYAANMRPGNWPGNETCTRWGPRTKGSRGHGWILTIEYSKNAGFDLLFIVTAAAFRPKNKYILSFVQSCMETFLRVGSHISNCSSLVVLLSSYLRKPILPLLLRQKFTIACKKGRRNFLSLSSSRRGKKKRKMIGKEGVLFFFF